MEWVRLFIIRYFVLLCISVVLLTTSIQRRKQHSKMSLCIVLIASVTLLLAVCNILEEYGKTIANIPLTTAFAFLGYVLRPACIYLFILMTLNAKNKMTYLYLAIPLFLNITVYMLAFIPATKEWVFYFHGDAVDGIAFGGGPLRFCAHLIGAGYLVFSVCTAASQLRSKHISGFMATSFCVLFVVLAVVIETFFNENGDVFLLNSTIAVSTLTYYLHLYTERSQIDTLTRLLNRTTYYRDLPKLQKSATGVILFDLNGLKHINDNFGHLEGDKALSTVAGLILSSAKKDMYGYRMGGDEFLLIALKSNETQIQDTIVNFKIALAKTEYFCSVGYCYRADRPLTIDEMLKAAEKQMYTEKDSFYRNSPFERRKA
ncbi:MAG: GGDEF domain-containing protein [Bacilli bacterium]|nr:GGDEF domain-containing protein [Bacilli bacterium]